MPASREEGLENATEADPEADNRPEGEDTSAVASRSEEAHPGPDGLGEQVENADVHPAAEERLSGNVGDSVEGGEQAEAELSRPRGLPNPDLHPGAEGKASV